MHHFLVKLSAVGLLFASTYTESQTVSAAVATRAAKQKDCIQEASHRYSVDANLLKAIGAVESGFNPGAIGKNTNGTEDLGIMQINSSWLPRLSKFGITRDKLLNEPCTNIHVGAWILADNIRRLGPTWNAVGAYNAVTVSKREKYVHKVWEKYMALSGGLQSDPQVVEVKKPPLRLI